MRTALAPLVLIAFLAVVSAAEPARAPARTTVACGQRLTQSTTLANDLANCAGDGLVVVANGITIDLAGHTVDGTGAMKSHGIVNNRHKNVTVENGTITDFYFSAAGVQGAGGNVFRRLTIRNIGVGCKRGDQCAGIFLFNAPRTTIVGSVISNDVRAFQVNGVDVYTSPAADIERNRIERNAGEGVAIFHSPNSRVAGNRFEANRGNGLHVNSMSDDVRVSANNSRGNGNAGIAVGASRGARVLGNTVSGNRDVGLLLFDLEDSVARGNKASDNGNGIVLYGGQAGVAGFGGKHGARHNRLLGNTAEGNSLAGILVRGDSRRESVDRNLLAGNVANRNGSKGGILIAGNAKGNRLRRNTANANAGHGIVAVRGTIDGGGNRARGNRRKPQCVRVRCS
jgi:parallel beta-helix repeat protein